MTITALTTTDRALTTTNVMTALGAFLRLYVAEGDASPKTIRSYYSNAAQLVEAARLEGLRPVLAILLAHLAFWDRRVMYVLDMTERDGKLFIPGIDISVNDLSLPLWAAIPPREAARIAIETAEALDKRLEGFPPALLEEIHAYNERWVVRALDRGEHLDEADATLAS